MTAQVVTDLEPYLGTLGHLVAFRQGDLGCKVGGRVHTAAPTFVVA